ncbi:hypothetical protein FRX31_009594 [Thalictrum thalictroides]|uniref:Uncharacterized protein n=1 Tax=Thalictrum thalictroides TaxID=46969 RepID=A0A7J6WVV9_THATH|nr:hypothetical protein FRX31_009594 [Thalictrum thalictroides]
MWRSSSCKQKGRSRSISRPRSILPRPQKQSTELGSSEVKTPVEDNSTISDVATHCSGDNLNEGDTNLEVIAEMQISRGYFKMD